MTLLSREDMLTYLMVEYEIPGAIRWATHYLLTHSWNEATLTLTVRLAGGSDRESEREPYLLMGCFEGYRVLPPAWRFLDPRNGRDIGLPAYPRAGPFENGSVLHGNGVICAPWNLLAYADKGGPHTDWAESARWQSLAPDRTSAHTIPDMLARIRAEVVISPGRLAALPPLLPEGLA